MASEILRLTTQIITSHASMTELTPEQLVEEIRTVYNMLAALECGAETPETVTGEAAGVKKPPIPLKNIVTDKFVTCLECGKKMKTLKTHLRKAHGLTAKEYYARFNLDPKKFPLVCKEYSAARSKLAKDRGLGSLGGRRRKAS
jgi:predicted transcriptional regulator